MPGMGSFLLCGFCPGVRKCLEEARDILDISARASALALRSLSWDHDWISSCSISYHLCGAFEMQQQPDKCNYQAV